MPSSLLAIFLKANSLQASSLKANSLKANSLKANSLNVMRAGFALNIVLLSLATVASAGPKEDVVTACKVLPGLKVAFGDQLIRVYGGTAVNTGYYTFSYVRDGETKSLPARYSFTYVKSGENWLIVDHHSSAMPPPPK